MCQQSKKPSRGISRFIVDTILHNARIYTEKQIVEGGIAIDEGRILRIAKETNLPAADTRINLKECLALPGLIDAHAHLRGQLQAYKEDFFTGTMAAIAGGFTSVLDMPNNTPVTMDSVSLRERIAVAQKAIMANVGFYCAFPESLTEISRIVESGAVAFKLYMNSQIGGLDINDDDKLIEAFAETHDHGIPIAIHAEDKDLVQEAESEQRKLGHDSVSAYLKAHKPEAEVKAVRRILEIALISKAQIHFCHVSTKETVALIHNARRKGVMVSCEVTPHHLLMSSSDLMRQGAIALTDPPFRSRAMIARLWEAVGSSLIDVIASDHAPHLIEEKARDSVWNVKPGIPNLETLLPLLLTKVNEERLSLDDLVRLTTRNPAELFHLHGQGSLKEGYDANITVVDMKRKSTIDSERFHSKGRYSPFHKLSVKGMPVKTFVNGQLMLDEGEAVGKAGSAKILRSNSARISS
ncbi:MAG: dihydroorotase family protein [Candidatus Bathyarchaeota archaeon]|nr:dihydroorotase family protein [Candidatus Bathyarchaeota archaeon]